MKTALILLGGLLAGCTTTVSTSPTIPEKRLLGTWYRGDGTGDNVTLTLNRDSTYNAVWTGCLGAYGTADGTWRLDASKLLFTPTEEQEMMRNYLRRLTFFPTSEAWFSSGQNTASILTNGARSLLAGASSPQNEIDRRALPCAAANACGRLFPRSARAHGCGLED